jgi:hypothetical protein
MGLIGPPSSDVFSNTEFGLRQPAARMSVCRLRNQLTAQLAAQDKRDLLRQQVKRFDLSRQPSAARPDSSSSSAKMLS